MPCLKILVSLFHCFFRSTHYAYTVTSAEPTICISVYCNLVFLSAVTVLSTCSITRLNSSGARPSPCFKPSLISKSSVIFVWTSTFDTPVVKQALKNVHPFIELSFGSIIYRLYSAENLIFSLNCLFRCLPGRLHQSLTPTPFLQRH